MGGDRHQFDRSDGQHGAVVPANGGVCLRNGNKLREEGHSADPQYLLRAMREHMAAAKQNRAEAERHDAEVERLIHALGRLTGGQLTPKGACRVIENHRVTFVTTEKAERLCQRSRADLVLDTACRRLRYVEKTGGRREQVWINNLRWGWYKALLVGMSRPGQPFGNRRINSRFPGYRPISSRTLSHDIAGLTKLIQGGGTEGPYIYRERVGPEVSDSGQGYVFTDRRRYLVIEETAHAAL